MEGSPLMLGFGLKRLPRKGADSCLELHNVKTLARGTVNRHDVNTVNFDAWTLRVGSINMAWGWALFSPYYSKQDSEVFQDLQT